VILNASQAVEQNPIALGLARPHCLDSNCRARPKHLGCMKKKSIREEKKLKRKK